ncbi:MAG: response regulator transcription factor [Prevotella sp.]|nr:response regulator transcription factor [Prevotella sp.]
MNIIIADNQDITRAGLLYILEKLGFSDCKRVSDKTELAYQLKQCPTSVVVLDYTLFDLNDADELMIVGQRFREAFLVLFSVDLSLDFARTMIGQSSQISILMKESSLQEIRECLRLAMRGQRYICQRMAEMLLAPSVSEERVNLTKTETEILKDIALGMTTKEIAEKRFSSFHTVNTHRKNIFRKLNVNNVHEATKYAFRAGLVDSAEYYI